MSAAKKTKAPVIGPTEAFKKNPLTRNIEELDMDSTADIRKAVTTPRTDAQLRNTILAIDGLSEESNEAIQAMAHGVLALLQMPPTKMRAVNIYRLVESIAHKASETLDNINFEAGEAGAAHADQDREFAICMSARGGL